MGLCPWVWTVHGGGLRVLDCCDLSRRAFANGNPHHLFGVTGNYFGHFPLFLRAQVLVANGETLDSIGQIGTDPGSAWGSGLLSTQNNTLRRHAQIVTGDSNTSDVFVPSLEWLGFDVDIFSGLGDHEFEPVLQQPRVEEPRVSALEPSSVMLLIIGLLFLQLKRSKISQFMSFRGEKLC